MKYFILKKMTDRQVRDCLNDPTGKSEYQELHGLLALERRWTDGAARGGDGKAIA